MGDPARWDEKHRPANVPGESDGNQVDSTNAAIGTIAQNTAAMKAAARWAKQRGSTAKSTERQVTRGTSNSSHALPRYSMKSDVLPWLQRFYDDGGLLAQFASYVKFHLIVDANIVLKDLRWLVKNRRDDRARPSLLELLEARAIIVFAPTYMVDEVSRHISTIATEQGLDEEAMRGHWNRYRPLITFIDVGEPPNNDGSWIDNKDVPYIQLQRLLALPIVTEDQHIEMMGGVAVPKAVTITLRTYARDSATQLSLEVAGAVSVNLSLKAVAAAAQTIRVLAGPTIAKLPKSTWLVLTGLFCLALLHPRTRKTLAATLLNAFDKSAGAFAALAPMLNSLHNDHTEAQARGNAALAELREALEMPQRESRPFAPAHQWSPSKASHGPNAISPEARQK